MFFKTKKNKPGYWGKYNSWQEALADANGYDSNTIIEKVKNSALEVKNGHAKFERDSVIFDKIEYSWPTLSCILQSIIENNNILNIIDFGGSLGSTYFAFKNFIPKNTKINWAIVEQPKIVSIGNNFFKSDELFFFETLKSAKMTFSPSIILLSSSLPYIEKPYELLDEIFAYSFNKIIIDRTPILKKENDRITLQIVPPNIYDASYPAWFFNEKNLLNKFKNTSYRLIADFEGIAKKIKLEDCIAYEKGYLFQKK